MSHVRPSAVASLLFLLTPVACLDDDPLEPEGQRVAF
jgi:hypothetical protein